MALGSLLLAGGGAFKHAQDVALLHDEELFAVNLDFGAGPLAEQHAIAGFHIERLHLALFIAGTRSRRDDLALLRLLLSRVRNNNAAGRALVLFNAAYDDRRATDEIAWLNLLTLIFGLVGSPLGLPGLFFKPAC